MSDVPAQPSRLEREINEILSKAEGLPPGPTKDSRVSSEVVARGLLRVARALSRVSLLRLILLTFLFIFGAFLFYAGFPFGGHWLTLAETLLFLASFALMLFGRRGDGSA